MGDNEWHYTGSADEDIGPVPMSVLVDAFKKGVIHDDTFIWHPTLCSAWTLCKDLPTDTKNMIDPPAKPAPPPPTGRRPVPPPPSGRPVMNNRTAAPTPAARAPAPAPAARAPAPTPNGAPATFGRQQPPPPGPPAPTPAPRNGNNNIQKAAAASAQRKSKGAPPPGSQRLVNRNLSNKGKNILFGAGMAGADPSGWVERKTADGVPYYHNVNSGALSWDRPDELKSHTEINAEQGSWVWFPDEKEGYVPATLLQTRPDGRSVCQLENGQQVTSGRGQKVYPLSKASLNRTERDLTLLDSLDEGLILYNLRKRFEEQSQIYTWIGDILVSINPYETLPIYGVKKIEEYKLRGNRILDPHVFVVADECLKPLLEYGDNHSILISGESGAGKTWNTKQCLSYITETTSKGRQKASDTPVEAKILAANPILESFGNAKTVRNDNSSRFGRFTEIHFNSNKSIEGARIDNFLLEKSRVVIQGKGERNYHVFYQLLSSDRVRNLGLTSMENYGYINKSGCFTVDGLDDGHEYQILIQGFNDMGFTDKEISWVFELVAAVLHLGNCTFVSDGGEGSVLNQRDNAGMQWIAKLLHVDQKELEHGLVTRSIEVRGEVTKIQLKPDAAQTSRDALSKSIYGQLFDWLVKRVNDSLEGPKSKNPWAFLGLLDIFGFEIFEHNSFEQLCINFTNEKLQQLFNRDTFKLEEALYQKEGIQFDHIKYVDNQPILDLIEMRPVGLLLTLDDMNRMPRSTDVGFVAKADSNHKSNRFYITSTLTRRGKGCFAIKHYAGEVVYNTDGFLEKNKDLLFKDLYDCLTASKDKNTAAMFPPMDKQGRAKFSLGAQFRKQLERLMGVLNATQTHYIRCIKPNEHKAPRMFEAKDCLDQLQYSGVFEAVRIRKQGFPFRYTYERFVERYKCVLLKGIKWVPLRGRSARDQVKEILDGTGQDFSEVRFGATMALYRSEQHRLLELLRALALEKVCAMIQAIARGFMARRFVRKVRMVTPDLEAAIASRDVKQLDQALEKFARACGHFSTLVADTGVVQVAKRLRFALVEWEKLAQEMNSVVQLDIPNDDLAFEALKNVVWKAEDLLDCPGTEWHTQMYDYSNDYFIRERARRCEPKLQRAMDLLERDVMTEVYSECKALRFEDPRLNQIEQFVGLSEDELLKRQYKRAKELNLNDRAREKEITLAEMYLDRNAGQFVFTEFPGLRNPVEFSSHSMQFWKREEMARNMLKWQKTPIKTSLTDMDPNLAKQASRLHRAVIGWCGDKTNPNPNSLAQEIIASGVGNERLRDEVFCQLMKQLTENPGQQSINQAWKLFGMCTMYFAPNSDLSNYVQIFIRNAAPAHLKENLKQQIYARVYEGVRSPAPSPDQIPQLASSF